jgi:alpha-galactosidase
MAGALGVGGNLLEWTAEELETARKHLAVYKEIRPLVALGDLYRLQSPRDGAFSSLIYVAKDKSEAALFAHRLLPNRPLRNPIIHVQGLDPDAVYRIEDAEPGKTTRSNIADGTVRSGKAWAELGLRLDLGDLESTIIRFKRV